MNTDTLKTFLLDLFGLPAVAAGILFNLDNLNSVLLAIGGIIYLGLKIRGQHLDNILKQRKIDDKNESTESN